jgi:predicted RNA methylase
MISEHDYRSYWNQNIERWGDFYLDISHGHETLNAPPWLAAMYRATVGRLERRLMAERYARTVVFLDRFVRPGITLSDLGCGTGIFVVEALKRGAVVNAIDFAPTAITITRDNVQRYAPSGTVNYRVADVTRDSLPLSDLALAMGLAPYIADLQAFLDNVLPTTEMLLCLYVDPDRWSNRLRAWLPLLNVRRLQFHKRSAVDAIYHRHAWQLIERRNFATGYIDLVVAPQGSLR